MQPLLLTCLHCRSKSLWYCYSALIRKFFGLPCLMRMRWTLSFAKTRHVDWFGGLLAPHPMMRTEGPDGLRKISVMYCTVGFCSSVQHICTCGLNTLHFVRFEYVTHIHTCKVNTPQTHHMVKLQNCNSTDSTADSTVAIRGAQ